MSDHLGDVPFLTSGGILRGAGTPAAEEAGVGGGDEVLPIEVSSSALSSSSARGDRGGALFTSSYDSPPPSPTSRLELEEAAISREEKNSAAPEEEAAFEEGGGGVQSGEFFDGNMADDESENSYNPSGEEGDDRKQQILNAEDDRKQPILNAEDDRTLYADEMEEENRVFLLASSMNVDSCAVATPSPPVVEEPLQRSSSSPGRRREVEEEEDLRRQAVDNDSPVVIIDIEEEEDLRRPDDGPVVIIDDEAADAAPRGVEEGGVDASALWATAREHDAGPAPSTLFGSSSSEEESPPRRRSPRDNEEAAAGVAEVAAAAAAASDEEMEDSDDEIIARVQVRRRTAPGELEDAWLTFDSMKGAMEHFHVGSEEFYDTFESKPLVQEAVKPRRRRRKKVEAPAPQKIPKRTKPPPKPPGATYAAAPALSRTTLGLPQQREGPKSRCVALEVRRKAEPGEPEHEWHAFNSKQEAIKFFKLPAWGLLPKRAKGFEFNYPGQPGGRNPIQYKNKRFREDGSYISEATGARGRGRPGRPPKVKKEQDDEDLKPRKMRERSSQPTIKDESGEETEDESSEEERKPQRLVSEKYPRMPQALEIRPRGCEPDTPWVFFRSQNAAHKLYGVTRPVMRIAMFANEHPDYESRLVDINDPRAAASRKWDRNKAPGAISTREQRENRDGKRKKRTYYAPRKKKTKADSSGSSGSSSEGESSVECLVKEEEEEEEEEAQERPEFRTPDFISVEADEILAIEKITDACLKDSGESLIFLTGAGVELETFTQPAHLSVTHIGIAAMRVLTQGGIAHVTTNVTGMQCFAEEPEHICKNFATPHRTIHDARCARRCTRRGDRMPCIFKPRLALAGGCPYPVPSSLTEDEEAEKGRLLRQQQEEDNIDDKTPVDLFPPNFCEHGLKLEGCIPSGRGKDSDNIFEETPKAFKMARTRKVLVVMGNSLKRTSNGTGLDWLRGCKNFSTIIVVDPAAAGDEVAFGKRSREYLRVTGCSIGFFSRVIVVPTNADVFAARLNTALSGALPSYPAFLQDTESRAEKAIRNFPTGKHTLPPLVPGYDHAPVVDVRNKFIHAFNLNAN